MRRVYKYELDFTTQLSLPKGARFLFLGDQDNQLVGWFEVDTSHDCEIRTFKLIMTGDVVKGDYCATIQMDEYIIHLYEVKNQVRLCDL